MIGSEFLWIEEFMFRGMIIVAILAFLMQCHGG
jgi:hypothetical protein